MHILVIGGTGTVGARLVEALSREGHSVRVASRRASALTELPAGARAVELDLARADTFAPAVAGVDRAFYLTPTGEPHADRPARAMFDVMRRAGVRRVVAMTGYGVERVESSPMRQLELALEGSGMGFTHLRPNYFMQNFCAGPLLRGIVEHDEIAVAIGDARIGYVDARDIAAVAVAALTRDGLEGRALAVTGARAVTHAEIAAAISEATGRTIRFRDLTEDEMRRALSAEGTPTDRVESRLRFLALARSGALSTPSDDVTSTLGRAPLSLDDFARDHAATWRREARS